MQRAGIAALTGPQESVEARRATYERRRDTTLDCLEAVESRSEGTFFVWFKLPDGLTAETLLEEHRVAVAPGEGFGERGAGWARLSLATPDDRLELGLERDDDLDRLAGGRGRPDLVGQGDRDRCLARLVVARAGDAGGGATTADVSGARAAHGPSPARRA